MAKKYTESSKSLKYCPGVDCIYAIQNNNYSSDIVECKCGIKFCFKCLNEEHEPCSCEMVGSWKLLNENESQNLR